MFGDLCWQPPDLGHVLPYGAQRTNWTTGRKSPNSFDQPTQQGYMSSYVGDRGAVRPVFHFNSGESVPSAPEVVPCGFESRAPMDTD